MIPYIEEPLDDEVRLNLSDALDDQMIWVGVLRESEAAQKKWTGSVSGRTQVLLIKAIAEARFMAEKLNVRISTS